MSAVKRATNLAQVQSSSQQVPVQQLKQPTSLELRAMESAIRNNKDLQTFENFITGCEPAAIRTWLNTPFKDSPHFLPLQAAIFNDNVQVAELLLKWQADPLEAKNPHYYDLSSLQYASFCQKKWFIDLFRKYRLDYFKGDKSQASSMGKIEALISNHLALAEDPLACKKIAIKSIGCYVWGPLMGGKAIAGLPRALYIVEKSVAFVGKKLLTGAPQGIQDKVVALAKKIEGYTVTAWFQKGDAFLEESANQIAVQCNLLDPQWVKRGLSNALKVSSIFLYMLLPGFIASHPYVRTALEVAACINAIADTYEIYEKNKEYRSHDDMTSHMQLHAAVRIFELGLMWNFLDTMPKPLPDFSLSPEAANSARDELSRTYAKLREGNTNQSDRLAFDFMRMRAMRDLNEWSQPSWGTVISSSFSILSSSLSTAGSYVASSLSKAGDYTVRKIVPLVFFPKTMVVNSLTG